VITFAVVNGDRKAWYGDGGRKLGKGAYRYNLGGGAIDEEDEDEVKTKFWAVLAEKEEKRILRVISK
jgi:hypothetical protein